MFGQWVELQEEWTFIDFTNLKLCFPRWGQQFITERMFFSLSLFNTNKHDLRNRKQTIPACVLWCQILLENRPLCTNQENPCHWTLVWLQAETSNMKERPVSTGDFFFFLETVVCKQKFCLQEHKMFRVELGMSQSSKHKLTLFLFCVVIIPVNDNVALHFHDHQFKRIHNLNVSAFLLSNQRTKYCWKK